MRALRNTLIHWEMDQMWLPSDKEHQESLCSSTPTCWCNVKDQLLDQTPMQVDSGRTNVLIMNYFTDLSKSNTTHWA